MTSVALRGVTMSDVGPYLITKYEHSGLVSRHELVADPLGGGRFSGPSVGESGMIVVEGAVLTPGLYSGSKADQQQAADTVRALWRTLAAAWAPNPEFDGVDEIAVAPGGSAEIFLGRPQSISPRTEWMHQGVMPFRASFQVTDPRSFETYSLTSAPVTVASTSGGFDTPLVTPMVSSGTGSTGDTSVFNPGTAPTPWKVDLTAPLTDPRIILNGRTVLLSPFDLLAGEVATVDSLTQRVTVSGADRPVVSFLSEWADVPPGQSTLSLRASGGTGSATLTLRPAYYP